MAGLFRKLRASEIECRVQMCNGKGVSLLLYKDSRCDMNILDESIGPMDWQCEYSRENANCKVSIWDGEKNQWISKEDTGTESNTEAEKGLASDSFKRACFKWGIGRELYTSPFIWVDAKDCRKLKQNDKGVWQCFDRFSVRDIGYYGGAIDYLVIQNDRGAIVYQHGDADPKQRMRQHYRDYCMRNGLDGRETAKRFNLTKESTKEDFEKALEDLKHECK